VEDFTKIQITVRILAK